MRIKEFNCLRKGRVCTNSLVIVTVFILALTITLPIIFQEKSLHQNTTDTEYCKPIKSFKTSSSEYTRITWEGTLDYNEYYVFWTDNDVDEDYELDYFFTGSNSDVDIELSAMTNASFDSWAFSDSYSITSYILFEGSSMSEFQTFLGIDYSTPWAFIFLNGDEDQESTYIEIDCYLFVSGGKPDVDMTGMKLQVEEDSDSPSLIDQLLPLMAIVGVLAVIGIGLYRFNSSKKKRVKTPQTITQPQISKSSASTSSYTSSETKPYHLSQEESDTIVRDAVAKTRSQASVVRRRNIRNGILSLALGTFFIVGGIISLDIGVGIYLLIAGTMFLALGGFLFALARIY